MSTKIFVHKQLKIKPPKAPDPSLDAMFEAQREAHRQREAQRQEDRRVMAQLRAEELAERAARLPTREEKPQWCCNFCWGTEAANKLFPTRKDLHRLYRSFQINGSIADAWLEKKQLDLADALDKTARVHGVALTNDQVTSIAVRATSRVLRIMEDEYPRIKAANAVEDALNKPKRFCG